MKEKANNSQTDRLPSPIKGLYVLEKCSVSEVFFASIISKTYETCSVPGHKVYK
jgi:hypothetical protein